MNWVVEAISLETGLIVQRSDPHSEEVARVIACEYKSDYAPCITRISPVCRVCSASMFLDDKDFRFKGNFDNYWNCTVCSTSCIEEVRFGERVREHWHSENDGKVIDQVFNVK